MSDSITHACPVDDSPVTPCCGRIVFELPRTDRIAIAGRVTCNRVVIDVTALFAEKPCDWWRFVACATCPSLRGEACVQGMAWPTPARNPHASRVRSARSLHGTLWLLASGFADDVVGGVA